MNIEMSTHSEESIDSLLLTDDAHSSIKTVQGPLPISQQGFHCRVDTPSIPRTDNAYGKFARAMRDGEVVCCGRIYNVEPRDNEITLFIEPPR